MYKRIISCVAALSLLMTTNVWAQDEKGEHQGEGNNKVSLSFDGVTVETKKSSDKTFGVEVLVLDLGINTLQDKTNYAAAPFGPNQFLNVPADYKNENLFSLRNGKSWNVNLWPVLAKWRIVNGRNQRIYLGTGVGLQMYNFRFTKPVTYINEVNPMVFLDSVNSLSKNKVGLTYLSVPLMLTFKTRAAEKAWLVYGIGVTGGYRIASYTKQVSTQLGKQKNQDKFNFSDFNACVTAEVGLSGYFRLYASYQVTPLHDDGILAQHPLSIGLRFGGI